MDRAVWIWYKNHRGEDRERKVGPTSIRFSSNQWHPDPQWLLEAWDYEKGETRTFAMKDISSWRPVEEKDG